MDVSRLKSKDARQLAEKVRRPCHAFFSPSLFLASALTSLLLVVRNLFSSALQKSDGIEDEMKDKLQKFRGSEAALFHFIFLLLLPLCHPSRRLFVQIAGRKLRRGKC